MIKKQFINYKSFLYNKDKIYLSKETILSIYHKKKVEISIINDKRLCLFNTIYILDLHKNLFLICNYNLEKRGILIKYQTYHFFIRDNIIFSSYLFQANLY